MSARCLGDVRTLQDWEQQRTQRRAELLEMLGLNPLPKRTPLQAEITGTLERPTHRIEKLVFQSSPGLYVTGNFYIPKAAPWPLPTILYLCGHSPHPQGSKVPYQDRVPWFVEHGYAVLVLDTLEFAEVEGPHHGTHNLHYWHWLSLGYTPAGVEVWNAMRALDFLETRPQVDMKRVGLTGISGGGAMTWYTAAVDDRIAVAAPSCSTFTYGSQTEHWLAAGQCDCIYYMNSYAWDFPVVGALIAPRPLIILSGQKDTIFPPDGYHAVFQRVKKVYDLYANGDSDRIREVDEDVPHSDSPLLLAEARQWMQRWLQNDRTPVPLEENPVLFEDKPADLAVLSTPPIDAINDRIHDQFIALPRYNLIESNDAWQKRRSALMTELREKIFGWFPKATIPFETQFTDGKGGWSGQYAEYKEATIVTEPGVRIRVQQYLPTNSRTAGPLLVHVKRPIDTFYSSDYDERVPVVDRAAVLVVTPRFTDPMLSTADYTNVERTAAWTGRSIAALQVWDTLRAIQWAIEEQKIPTTRIVLFGRENAAIVALYAALFDERITGVILADPPASHWQGPALLNVLRVTDIPEVAAALAPRELMFLRALPPGFVQTEALLKQLGQADSVRVVGSLAAGMGISN